MLMRSALQLLSFSSISLAARAQPTVAGLFVGITSFCKAMSYTTEQFGTPYSESYKVYFSKYHFQAIISIQTSCAGNEIGIASFSRPTQARRYDILHLMFSEVFDMFNCTLLNLVKFLSSFIGSSLVKRSYICKFQNGLGNLKNLFCC